MPKPIRLDGGPLQSALSVFAGSIGCSENCEEIRAAISGLAERNCPLSQNIQFSITRGELSLPWPRFRRKHRLPLVPVLGEQEPEPDYLVAFSFSGSNRDEVIAIKDHLAETMDSEKIFYDNAHRPQLSRPGLDLKLQQIYQQPQTLKVVFLSEGYRQSPWCQVEWDAIRNQYYFHGGKERTMFVRFDDARVEGSLDIHGFIDARELSPREIADSILEKHQSLPAMES